MPGIPGEDLPGVHTLRSMADARRLRGELLPGRRLLVVGGGWIGLEAAASARRLGVEVVVIERGSRLCARSVPPDISAFLLRLHRRHAVDVQVQGAVDRLERSAHGETLLAHTHRGIEAFDLVLIGIGLEPSVELAVSCGLHVDDGIVVDASGRTSDPCIFAAGDVANQPCARNDAAIPARIRLESWANAQNHGIAVGRAVAGLDPLPGDLPWFWSDQYDVNMQVLGMATDVGAWVLRGSFEDAGFCLFQLADGRLQAAIAVNRARELKLAKRLAKAGKRLDPERLRDPGVRLESM